MESKATFVPFLLLIISAATAAGIGKQSSVKDDFLRNINEQRLRLCNGFPGERSVHVYVFNLTNPEDFLNKTNGDFQEIGPFNFKETRSRKNCWVTLGDLEINFEDERKVSADSKSSKDFDAPLTTVNIAFSVKYLAWTDLLNFVRKGEGYLKQDSTPRALLTDGYDISDINSYIRYWYTKNLLELQHDTFTPFMEVCVLKFCKYCIHAHKAIPLKGKCIIK
ncbi:unnamed protein product [Allacma fusca]|uniref:Uncharacterized protein n=1 Tax=Allacma fusca TaxID=39272 RepID=A0A8J2K176_9HEXA|nr:unnamed protein product [Allacma fusca]